MATNKEWREFYGEWKSGCNRIEPNKVDTYGHTAIVIDASQLDDILNYLRKIGGPLPLLLANHPDSENIGLSSSKLRHVKDNGGEV